MNINILPKQLLADCAKTLTDIASKYNHPMTFAESDFQDKVTKATADVLWFRNDNNSIRNFLIGKIPDRKGTIGPFFHFKSPSFAEAIIRSQKIQVSSMEANSANDFAEYSEYFVRLGQGSSPKIDEYRRVTYILCLTKDMHNPQMWKEYGACNDIGVCLELTITPSQASHLSDWQFRDVHYDSGYDFDFIREMCFVVKQEHSLRFTPPAHLFAQFYKRDRYRWENESRLAIQFEDLLNIGRTLKTMFPQCRDPKHNRDYLDIPLKNDLFEISIKNVYYGPNIAPGDLTPLQATCNSTGIALLPRQRI